MSDHRIAPVILELVEARGTGRTICPSEVARAIEADEQRWRALMRPIREVAASLAREGRIVITRKGKVIDPDNVRGVIRLGKAPPRAGSS